ncbi:MAG: metallopeptidase TldD-related protein [Syntrophaceae bacterium]
MTEHSHNSELKMKSTLKTLFFLILLIMFLMNGQILAASPGDDIVMKAMTDEMNRSKARLKMDNLNKPYYIDYTIIDQEMMFIEASFGGIKSVDKDHYRYLRISVRVGDYALDNTNFISTDMRSGMYHSVSLPIENDYDAIRQALWLATDQAYKDALESFSMKKAYMKNTNQTEQTNSFTHEDKPANVILPDVEIEWNESQWQQTCRDLSNLFKKFPQIDNSDVRLTVVFGKQYFVSSEGAQVIQPGSLCDLFVTASTQAVDGMKLNDFVTFYVNTSNELPKTETIYKEIVSMAQRLTSRHNASILNSYVGPVILEGQAAGEFFRQLLGKNLCGVASPQVENKMMEQYFTKTESGFKNKMGLRILPSSVNVVADPLTTKYKNKELTGSYAIDDEGIPAQKVQLVDKGVLTGFMLSRTPVKGFKKSNGHGRSVFTEPCSARISNLFVNVTNSKKQESLKQQLMGLCKQQNREYGLLVTSLEQADLPASEDDNMGRPFGFGSTRESLLSKPVSFYKVFTDGRTEPVRGADFGEVTLSLLKDIILAKDDYYVHNFIDVTATPFMHGVGGGVTASIVAPAVLLEELEIKNMNSPQPKPPLLPHPYFK